MRILAARALKLRTGVTRAGGDLWRRRVLQQDREGQRPWGEALR